MAEDHRLGSVARRLAATRRVLVVEDEQDVADFLRAYFRASGYDPVHVDPNTPLEVLDALDTHSPDCVLLDLDLAGFGAEEAYRLIRTDARYALTPVIVAGAARDARGVAPGAGGVDGSVAKPFNAKLLAGLVADRIENAEALREAATGHDVTRLLGQEYVEARLVDEIKLAAPERPASFAIVRLVSLGEIVTSVGQAGADYVVRVLVQRAAELLPADATLGITGDDDLAVLFPGVEATEAARHLRSAADRIDEVRLPGGAQVPLELAAGVASYPHHAQDADGVYMAADAALADAVEARTLVAIAL